MRHNVAVLFIMSIVVNIGMWLERFVIVVISLTRDFVPSAWGRYSPTFWDWATFIGTMGMYVTLIYLFVRVLPAISIAEMRELVAHTSEEHERWSSVPTSTACWGSSKRLNILSARRRNLARPDTGRWTPTLRFPLKDYRKRWVCGVPGCPFLR